MVQIRSVGEALELAITREVQAVQFYTELAERMSDPLMQVVFEQLAEEELKHKAKLELEMMKEGLVAKSLGQLIEVEPAKYSVRIHDEANLDYKDIVELAIRKERLAFRYYTQLAGLIPDPEVREVLLRLAEEEARHVVLFETEYDKIVAQDK